MKLFYTTEDALETYKANRTKAESGFDLSFFVNKRKEAKLENGIGHVFVYGMLIFDAAPIDKALGNTDYKDVEADIQSMIDQGAKAILLHVNSGGGYVLGCMETSEFIQNLPVPVVTHVDGICCSAAYKLASGSTYIIATKSSQVGNIGTIAVYADTSEMMQRIGVQYIAFYNEGAIYKSIGHTDSLTQEQIDYLQAGINKAGEEFQNHVKANRSVSEDVFTAAWYNGAQGVEAGLVDEIGGVEMAIQRTLELIEVVPNESEEIDTPDNIEV
jgi:protease-4